MTKRKKTSRFYAYLDDEQVYSRLEDYWLELFKKIMLDKGLSEKDWVTPLYNTTFSNGEKFMDANPIFSAKIKAGNRSIKIIHDHIDDEIENHWIETSDDKNELVIVCALPEKSANVVESLIRSWI
ncbi:hypothetical protein [Burkholderia sp. LMG 21824]|uniref:hypothetical protein n=1 Tax=Burkholderia sp. LMG 21824 TaxID=3158172 RepID=UPI003C306BE6